MTEFYTHCGDERYFEFDGKICDDETGMELDANSIVRLLNENEQLKLQNKQYSMMVNVNSDLNDEIYMQLKKTEKNYKSLLEENEQLKQQLFETSKELLWATSDEVDRVLYYEDEVEELRKEIFE